MKVHPERQMFREPYPTSHLPSILYIHMPESECRGKTLWKRTVTFTMGQIPEVSFVDAVQRFEDDCMCPDEKKAAFACA